MTQNHSGKMILSSSVLSSASESDLGKKPLGLNSEGIEYKIFKKHIDAIKYYSRAFQTTKVWPMIHEKPPYLLNFSMQTAFTRHNN